MKGKFKSKIYEILQKDPSDKRYGCLYFHMGNILATNGSVMVKSSMKLHDFTEPEIERLMFGKYLSLDKVKVIQTYTKQDCYVAEFFDETIAIQEQYEADKWRTVMEITYDSDPIDLPYFDYSQLFTEYKLGLMDIIKSGFVCVNSELLLLATEALVTPYSNAVKLQFYERKSFAAVTLMDSDITAFEHADEQIGLISLPYQFIDQIRPHESSDAVKASDNKNRKAETASNQTSLDLGDNEQ